MAQSSTARAPGSIKLGQVTELAAQDHDRDDHDRDLPPRHHLYGDLASWWPLLSRPDEYAEEAAFAASLLRTAKPPTRTVLELGSGGGNNAFHLQRDFEMTLVDLRRHAGRVASLES